MLTIKPYFLSIFLLILFSCKSSEEKIAERNAIIDSTLIHFQKNALRNQLDSLCSSRGFNGSIAVFQNGATLYKKSNGFADFKTKSKINDQSVFAIGSVSKQFTAALVLLQEEAGKLKTKEKVANYLEEFNTPPYQNITIHQLLNHTSGLDDFTNGLKFKSGTDFNYSNKGYRFLGALIEKVTGKTYTENVMELFEKSGMKNASTAENFNQNHFAGANLGTISQHSGVENLPKSLMDKRISIPAGGIFATVQDLHLWDNALYGGQIVKPESLQKLLKESAQRGHPIFGKVGYGYGIMTHKIPIKSYFHTGYVKGSPSLNVYYPDSNTSLVILSNLADESHGINGVFKTHLLIQNIVGNLEYAAQKTKAELLNPTE